MANKTITNLVEGTPTDSSAIIYAENTSDELKRTTVKELKGDLIRTINNTITPTDGNITLDGSNLNATYEGTTDIINNLLTKVGKVKTVNGNGPDENGNITVDNSITIYSNGLRTVKKDENAQILYFAMSQETGETICFFADFTDNEAKYYDFIPNAHFYRSWDGSSNFGIGYNTTDSHSLSDLTYVTVIEIRLN